VLALITMARAAGAKIFSVLILDRVLGLQLLWVVSTQAPLSQDIPSQLTEAGDPLHGSLALLPLGWEETSTTLSRL
jgi:hypothetical protein